MTLLHRPKRIAIPYLYLTCLLNWGSSLVIKKTFHGCRFRVRAAGGRPCLCHCLPAPYVPWNPLTWQCTPFICPASAWLVRGSRKRRCRWLFINFSITRACARKLINRHQHNSLSRTPVQSPWPLPRALRVQTPPGLSQGVPSAKLSPLDNRRSYC